MASDLIDIRDASLIGCHPLSPAETTSRNAVRSQSAGFFNVWHGSGPSSNRSSKYDSDPGSNQSSEYRSGPVFNQSGKVLKKSCDSCFMTNSYQLP